MDEQYDGLEEIIEDELLDENFESQDECEPNVEDLYVRQLNETEIQNAIDNVKEGPVELKDDEPDIMDIESEFANAKISPSKESRIIRYLRG